MNKKQFISELERNLKGISREDKKEILRDYEEHFAIGKKKRRIESEIAKSLGNPKQLAKQAKMELLVTKAEDEKSVKNILKVVFATLSLSFFNLVFVVGIFFAFLGVVIALFATGISIIISGLTLAVVAFFPSIEFFYITAFNHIVMFFGGITLISLGSLFTIGAYYTGKGFYILIIKYVRLNIKIIRGIQK